LSCEEHETAIADRAQMHRAVVEMGFVPTVRIRKIRRSGTFGELTVCLDELDSVGVFVEVERQVPDGVPGEAVQAELTRFVESLGIQVERCLDTYDSLVRASAAYEDAWESWNASYGAATWDATTADGMGS
jgi:adenylate cyclase, class 2